MCKKKGKRFRATSTNFCIVVGKEGCFCGKATWLAAICCNFLFRGQKLPACQRILARKLTYDQCPPRLNKLAPIEFMFFQTACNIFMSDAPRAPFRWTAGVGGLPLFPRKAASFLQVGSVLIVLPLYPFGFPSFLQHQIVFCRGSLGRCPQIFRFRVD